MQFQWIEDYLPFDASLLRKVPFLSLSLSSSVSVCVMEISEMKMANECQLHRTKWNATFFKPPRLRNGSLYSSPINKIKFFALDLSSATCNVKNKCSSNKFICHMAYIWKYFA